MKAYINKENKSLVVYSNFTPSDTTNLIELTETQYQELQEKKKNNFIPHYSIENDNVVITYTEDTEKKLRKELKEIKQWFIDNDWKVNKAFIGEWTTKDDRWISYLEERTLKRARQDEINAILNEKIYNFLKNN